MSLVSQCRIRARASMSVLDDALGLQSYSLARRHLVLGAYTDESEPSGLMHDSRGLRRAGRLDSQFRGCRPSVSSLEPVQGLLPDRKTNGTAGGAHRQQYPRGSPGPPGHTEVVRIVGGGADHERVGICA